MQKNTKSLLVLKSLLYSGSYFLWLFLLIYLSLLPNLSGPSIEIPYFDKIVHLGFYFVASFLFLLLVEKTSLKKLTKNIKIFSAIVFHLLIGVSIEYLQHTYVSGRSGELEDVIANFLGILLAIISYYSKWNYFSRPN